MKNPNERRVLTAEEFAELQQAMKDPEWVKTMLEDAARADMVEVDNPMRREVRYRRGMEPRGAGA